MSDQYQEEMSEEAALDAALRVIYTAAVKQMQSENKNSAYFSVRNLVLEAYQTEASKTDKITVTDLMIGSRVGDLPDGAIVRREDGVFMRLTPSGWEVENLEILPNFPKHEHGQKWLYPPEPAPAKVNQPVMTRHGACPLNKDPCKMSDPNCNVSPGLFVASMHGKQFNVCGDCLDGMGAEVIGSARSL